MTTDSSATQKLTPKEVVSLVEKRTHEIERVAEQELAALTASVAEKQHHADYARITAIQDELLDDNGASNENTL
ncbi:MAG: hypothetical protein A2408_02955 [Candidatus Yonathbacteria bacterium RIFOXYC1_FULL_52_10]|uniref:Uncharacterized protein n=1 Tax=Candidatus Yonathbacteria bacterium RIFOXYD1_FULL_52_36 TaxID=1802730 RepID=A0A1G2SIU1_9BACT|nr:MAG: hypothetical protein A2408_02955 [Candidatus Yonathbacteria bacterium RIFOXYC1_FULL_52_10]OHA84638.1 MAG: hypothetical protein A2591_02850 [Candidatus Yonathbacteria bacterium RIFOXYD1_FULL_52_36]